MPHEKVANFIGKKYPCQTTQSLQADLASNFLMYLEFREGKVPFTRHLGSFIDKLDTYCITQPKNLGENCYGKYEKHLKQLIPKFQ